ncbi:hypothetical protein PORCRE_974 [Porphyromonas crevioricanis JCM 15906]|uniref:Uncharacterized protein n=1 Tax=Porphyromonas crevioricanis JCM 15906 TaxID=1305617 RepID=T1DSI1_9PORP|nr:hypothetical protein PORCRE_974 [Porphyromonas crevioricanis JCM 15906]GAD06648.1 hypothetical protein PORCAN_246 [Porphyromonas crevioricanis JCM 13913]
MRYSLLELLLTGRGALDGGISYYSKPCQNIVLAWLFCFRREDGDKI